MNIADININPLFENLLPPLADDEFVGLEADIVKRKKILNPILVWSNGNYIIDGHNRYKILIAHKMDTDNIVPMDFDTESEVMAWIVDSQFAKRNLTKSQKVILLQKVEEQVRKEAKERQIQAGKEFGRGQAKVTSNLTEAVTEKEKIPETAEIMAKKLGVSKNTYKDMKTIVESGSQEKIARMDKGGKGNGVSAIAREIRDGIPDGHMRCRKCGKIKTFDLFKKGDNICKECRNKEDGERKQKEREKEEIQVTEPREHKTPKSPFANSFAPASYYDVDRPANWTYKEVKGEADFVFSDTLKKLRNIFNQHKEDVFSEDAHIIAFANEVQAFASSVKFLEKEIRDARHQKELEF